MLIWHMMSSPLNIQEMEALAREKLPREVFDYYAGGSPMIEVFGPAAQLLRAF
jgi:hypothetical protein